MSITTERSLLITEPGTRPAKKYDTKGQKQSCASVLLKRLWKSFAQENDKEEV